MASPQRICAIPFYHLESEVAAFPLASEVAFELSINSLIPNLEGEKQELFWAKAEQELVKQFPSLNIEEVLALRDYFWFSSTGANQFVCNSKAQDIRLHQYTRRIAGHFLTRQGLKAIPRLEDGRQLWPYRPEYQSGEDQTPQEARWAFRWLSFALPHDLLLAALGKPGDMPGMVNQVSPKMEQRLFDKGFAEPHLHLNAGITFKMAWAGLMYGLKSSLDKELFVSPGSIFKGGEDWLPWLIRIACARFCMAHFLVCRRNGEDFCSYLERLLLLDFNIMSKDERKNIVNIFLEIIKGSLITDNYHQTNLYINEFYSDMINYIGNNNSIDDTQRIDPISVFFSYGRQYEITPEMNFIAKSFEYMDNIQDDFFETLFWQIQRVRCLFYRHVVQRPMTPGLQWFIRFFSRIKPARSSFSKSSMVQSAAKGCGLGMGLKAMEIRIAPASDDQVFKKEIQSYLNGFNSLEGLLSSEGTKEQQKHPECGIVVHFVRDRNGGFREGKNKGFWENTTGDTRNYRDPLTWTQFWRHAPYYAEIRRSANALGHLIRKCPEVLFGLRGLDLCTDELGIPTWVFVPVFSYLRQLSQTACAYLPDIGKHKARLRLTAHVGEDFVHLATGIRRMDEAFRHLGLEEGDRLGHGLALGVDAKQWAECTGRIFMRREQRLFDLVWEYGCYVAQRLPATSERSIFLEGEISALSHYIFGIPATSMQVLRFREALHNNEVLNFVIAGLASPMAVAEFKNQLGQMLEDDNAAELFWKYLADDKAFRRGKEISVVDPTKDCGFLSALQNRLRQDLSSRGIVLEVNPSSNLLIGNMPDMRNHPLWNLMPPDGRDDPQKVSISIGSDDPLTFATDLKCEYQFVQDTMSRLGFSDDQTIRWLNRVQKTGMESRFTLPIELLRPLPSLMNLPRPVMPRIKPMP